MLHLEQREEGDNEEEEGQEEEEDEVEDDGPRATDTKMTARNETPHTSEHTSNYTLKQTENAAARFRRRKERARATRPQSQATTTRRDAAGFTLPSRPHEGRAAPARTGCRRALGGETA